MKKILCLLGFLFCMTCFAGGSNHEYSYQGESYEGFFIKGKNASASPLVFILHDWDGLTDYEKNRANMLAEQGYDVFAVDLFGKGIRPTKVEDKRQHTGELYKNRKKMRGIMQAAIASAEKLDMQVGNAVAIGYCFGGAAALELARSGENLKGFVSIHGGLSTPEGQDYSKTKGKLLVQHGAADDHISMEQFSNLTGLLEKNGVDHEMIVYGGAPHAWTVFGRKSYREDADKRAWLRLKEFLESTLK